VLALEKAEESGAIVMIPELKLVLDGRNPANYAFTVARKKQLDGPVFMEWMALGIDELVNVAAQRGDPVWIPLVQSEWQLNELTPIAFRAYGLDANNAIPGAQIRSISRPTRWNASST
jgi:hypothetical protein